MREKLELTGIILGSMPVGDYDKRIVILTKERGKITAFAKGARKPNSPYLGISEPFNFGTFFLYESYDAYRFAGGEIKDFFLDVKKDIEGICYATYFCDVVEYLCVEGIGDIHVLNLLYITLKALMKPKISNSLIRRIFELKMLALDGEAMVAFSCAKCGEKDVAFVAFHEACDGLLCEKCVGHFQGSVPLSGSCVYTIQYILSATLDKLYTFQVTEEVMRELELVVQTYFRRHVTKKFNSLEILSSLS